MVKADLTGLEQIPFFGILRHWPYASTHAYVMACYDKDIYYYSHASDEDLDPDLVDNPTEKEDFIAELRSTRARLLADPSDFLPQEPFALVHGDFCGRNILVHDGHVRSIIDWEFAGFYPLNEVVGGTGIELFELEDANLMEYGMWGDRMRDLLVDKARFRGWEEEKVELLVGQGNTELQLARREMVPLGDYDCEDGGDGDENEEAATEEVNGLSISE